MRSILVKITPTNEEYEDVHPELIFEDFLENKGASPGFEFEVLGYEEEKENK